MTLAQSLKTIAAQAGCVNIYSWIFQQRRPAKLSSLHWPGAKSRFGSACPLLPATPTNLPDKVSSENGKRLMLSTPTFEGSTRISTHAGRVIAMSRIDWPNFHLTIYQTVRIDRSSACCAIPTTNTTRVRIDGSQPECSISVTKAADRTC